MTYADAIRAGCPGADAAEVEHILWGMTPFPFRRVTAQELFKAGSRFRRACANGRQLCDLCPNQVTLQQSFTCERCRKILRWTAKE